MVTAFRTVTPGSYKLPAPVCAAESATAGVPCVALHSAIKPMTFLGEPSPAQTVMGRILSDVHQRNFGSVLHTLSKLPDAQKTAPIKEICAYLGAVSHNSITPEQQSSIYSQLLAEYYSQVCAKLFRLPKDKACEFTSITYELNDRALILECQKRKWAPIPLSNRSETLKIQALIAWEIFSFRSATRELNTLQSHLARFLGESEMLSSIASQTVALSPLLQPYRSLDECGPLPSEVIRELQVRVEMLHRIFLKIEALEDKYPAIKTALEDANHPLSSFARRLRLHVILMPDIDTSGGESMGAGSAGSVRSLLHPKLERLHTFCSELLSTDYGDGSLFFLEKALQKCAFIPSSSEIADRVALRAFTHQFTQDLLAGTLVRAPESLYKPVFRVTAGDLSAKYKPLDPQGMKCETVSCTYDRLAGIGITQAIRPVHYIEHLPAMDRLREYYSRGSAEDMTAAAEFFSTIPDPIKNAIYGETYKLFGEGRDVWDLGKILWLGDTLTSEQRLQVIQSMYDWGRGVIQLWIPGIMFRAYDLLKWGDAVEKLKGIPKAPVHFHVLSGLIKGSRDNSSGNTIFTFSDDYRIRGIREFDDELSLPTRGTHRDIRLWQLGLPQSAAPFDRATLMMFADRDWIANIERYNKQESVPVAVQAEQRRRLYAIVDLFNAELSKETITLTPRDLFFHICGGREEYTALVAAGISPWEIFERELSGTREIPFITDAGLADRIRANLAELYT